MSDILPDEAPAPRLCHLIKWDDFDGYGFNLHAEQSNPGQFIGKIDEDSPARMAGLREGDRIVEVNGVNISNENHKQVVERIKLDPNEARLLVVDPEADLWYRERELVVKSSQINVVYIKTPVPRPGSDSPRAKHGGPAAPTSNQSSVSDAGQKSQESSSEQQQKQQQQQQDEKQSTKESNQQQAQNDSAPSLETSDFNDDSLEQHPNQRAHSTTPSPRAPMSPDSGRGLDEAPANRADQQQAGHVLTVEAEINRQTQAAGVDALAKGRKQQVVDEVKRQIQDANKLKMQKQRQDNGAADIQPASLETDGSERPLDAKERARQVHNRSADSGKSSSHETATSGNDTDNNASSHSSLAADSLDEHLPSREEAEKEQPKEPLATNKTPSAKAALMNSSGVDLVEAKKGGEETMTIGATATPSGELNEKVSSHKTTGVATAADANLPQSQPSLERQNSINIHNNNNDHDHKVYEKSALQQQQHQAGVEKVALATSGAAQQLTSPVTVTYSNKTTTTGQPSSATAMTSAPSANNNNNKSTSPGGLNLNMTASQMRELIASRKKFDPKKAQMNIRQKYEIIQQM